MFQMLGVFAEFERAMISERVNAGLARARERGTKSGRAIGRLATARSKRDRMMKLKAAGKSAQASADELGIGKTSVYGYGKQARQGLLAAPRVLLLRLLPRLLAASMGAIGAPSLWHRMLKRLS